MVVVFTLLMICITVTAGLTASTGAITGCVLTRALTPTKAVRLAAACIFLGGIAASCLNMRVAKTFYGIAGLCDDPSASLLSLCCALLASFLWSLFAHSQGIPTSESHALLSGLTGTALSRCPSLSAIRSDEWSIVFSGFILSILPSCVLGFLFNGVLRALLLRLNRRRAVGHFRRSQMWSAVWSACVCGAQDSQKFAGVYMLGLSLCSDINGEASLPFSVLLLCSCSLALGSLLGAPEMIKRVGAQPHELGAHEYSAAGAAASFTVTLCTLFGLPSDLLQARACAFLGAGLSHKKRSDVRIAMQMLGAWLLTFPVCLSLGFILSELASALPSLG